MIIRVRRLLTRIVVIQGYLILLGGLDVQVNRLDLRDHVPWQEAPDPSDFANDYPIFVSSWSKNLDELPS